MAKKKKSPIEKLELGKVEDDTYVGDPIQRAIDEITHKKGSDDYTEAPKSVLEKAKEEVFTHNPVINDMLVSMGACARLVALENKRIEAKMHLDNFLTAEEDRELEALYQWWHNLGGETQNRLKEAARLLAAPVVQAERKVIRGN